MNEIKEWNIIRNYVLKRDNYTCTTCNWTAPKKLTFKLHIHHVIPWKKCRIDDPTNLIVLCVYCHTLYTALKQHNSLDKWPEKFKQLQESFK